MEILLPLPGTEPIPCYLYREELLSVCLASGNRRVSCYRSREQSSVTVPKKKLRRALPGSKGISFHILESSQGDMHPLDPLADSRDIFDPGQICRDEETS